MSNTYALTTNILAQIERIKGYDYAKQFELVTLINDFQCFYFDANRQNITKILLDVKDLLGGNPEYIKSTKELEFEYSGWGDWILPLIPKTQVKALSDKWFSLQEIDGKAAPSLWDSEGGQEKVLGELEEILKRI